MYIRFVTFRFPSQNKAEALIAMMSAPLWQKRFEKETKSTEQILIRSGEGRLVGMGIYKSQEDFDESSKMLKIMFMDLVKSFDGILEWHDGDLAFHYKRQQEDEK